MKHADDLLNYVMKQEIGLFQFSFVSLDDREIQIQSQVCQTDNSVRGRPEFVAESVFV
jgi:hypothetical protein